MDSSAATFAMSALVISATVPFGIFTLVAVPASGQPPQSDRTTSDPSPVAETDVSPASARSAAMAAIVYVSPASSDTLPNVADLVRSVTPSPTSSDPPDSTARTCFPVASESALWQERVPVPPTVISSPTHLPFPLSTNVPFVTFSDPVDTLGAVSVSVLTVSCQRESAPRKRNGASWLPAVAETSFNVHGSSLEMMA